jgi:hypothetical protein
MLKYNIHYFKDVSGIDFLISQLNQTHDLKLLKQAFYQHWDATKKKYPKIVYKREKSREKTFRKNLDFIIEKLSAIDKDSSATRFSEDKEGYFSIDNHIVDVQKLKELTDSVVPYLNRSIDIFESIRE